MTCLITNADPPKPGEDPVPEPTPIERPQVEPEPFAPPVQDVPADLPVEFPPQVPEPDALHASFAPLLHLTCQMVRLTEYTVSAG
jgi:hypothetical protein